MTGRNVHEVASPLRLPTSEPAALRGCGTSENLPALRRDLREGVRQIRWFAVDDVRKLALLPSLLKPDLKLAGRVLADLDLAGQHGAEQRHEAIRDAWLADLRAPLDLALAEPDLT